MPEQPPSATALEATFDRAPEFTVGIEEELMLLDPGTLELAPRARELLEWVGDDERLKLEFPASQFEIATQPHASVSDAIGELISARRHLVERAEGRVSMAGAAVSPLGSGSGQLIAIPRYERMLREYGPVARRQLVCALQVHVSVPGSARALAVYNHVRSYLPWLAALAANGAFYEGRDTGFASVRPKLAELLPRQRIPPAFDSWEQYAEALAWGRAAGRIPDPGSWWWELRPHPAFGTLEFRVPDSQSTVAEAGALAAVIHALVVWLSRRFDAGEPLPVAASWRLEENRWSACRHGVEGEMADPHSGRQRTTRACWEQLLPQLAGVAEELGSAGPLNRASEMVAVNGAIAQRRAAARGGARAVAQWLVERFLDSESG